MRTPSRAARRLTAAAAAAALALPLVAPASTAARTSGPVGRQITYQQWDTQEQFLSGRFAGTEVVDGVLRLSDPVAVRTYRDPFGKPTKRYELGRWASSWQRPGYAFEELVPSWDAITPGDSWVQIQVRGRSESGRRSKWYTLANWAAHDRRFHRTSLPAQADDLAQVNVDTLRTRYSMGFTAWRMRVTLLRKIGTRAVPRVDTVGAMTSLLPATDRVVTSRPGAASGTTLDLPRFSQMIHEGHYPEYDAGGEAWCSPTSVSMVLGGLDRLPPPRQYAWVGSDHPDPWVDNGARRQYDYRYEGAGNWSFSTAFAATRADNAFVTRLRHLREAERFVKAGIPLVASVRFGRDELTGSPLSSTNGHLLVIVGFTESGDVVVNDPAAPDNAGVVRTYDRGEFENAWIPGSGGLVYVIHDDDTPLPPTRHENW